MLTAVALVNGLTPGAANGRTVPAADPLRVVRDALAIDPPSLAALRESDMAAFAELAGRLRAVFEALDAGNVDGAAAQLNRLLSEHPATPHLAKEDGVWRLHHHPADAALVPMWTSICAESMARLIGAQGAHRLGLCSAARCDRAFVDMSKNATRRYCSAACQGRAKTAAFRTRRAGAGQKAE